MEYFASQDNKKMTPLSVLDRRVIDTKGTKKNAL